MISTSILSLTAKMSLFSKSTPGFSRNHKNPGVDFENPGGCFGKSRGVLYIQNPPLDFKIQGWIFKIQGWIFKCLENPGVYSEKSMGGF